MGKKKFDLSVDIVGNGLRTEQAALEYISINNKEVAEEDQSDTLTIRTVSSVKHEFKLYCVQNKIKMHEAFARAFELLKSSTKNPESK